MDKEQLSLPFIELANNIAKAVEVQMPENKTGENGLINDEPPVVVAINKRSKQNLERQEISFIKIVNEAIANSEQKKINLKAGNIILNDVVLVQKVKEKSSLGTESYSDIRIKTADEKQVLLSMKGEHTPSIGGGGIRGLNTIVKPLLKQFLENCKEYIKNYIAEKYPNLENIEQKTVKELDIPQIFGLIPKDKYNEILAGNIKMGGPVDYIYVGPMEVEKKNQEENIIELNGSLYSIEEFSVSSTQLYFRCRYRRGDQKIDLESVDKNDYPYIFSRSMKRSRERGRRVDVFTQQFVPKDAHKISLSENKQSFKEYLLEAVSFALDEELENQQQLMKDVKQKLDKLDGEELGILSVTPSNKSDMAIVVRSENKEQIEKIRSEINSAIGGNNLKVKNRLIPKYDSSIECTQVSYNDDSGRVYIVYKYDIGSREGLALEHVVAMVLTGKITEELKNRLDLPPEASKEEVKEKLKGDYADVLDVALKGKKLIENRIGKIIETKSLGSKNAKADLILITEDGKKFGLSIKLVTEEGRELRFTYNKNLGYGDEQDDNLVRNPSGKPWWLVGRQILAKKLGKGYNPKEDDFEPPSWMEREKEERSEAYKESMEEVYEKLREVFVNNLRRMKLKELVEMVNEAHLGENEEDYEELLVLVSDVDGLRLENQEEAKPDIEKIKNSGMTKNDIVKQDGARIIIDIPGMEPLTIHGLKFQNNMLSSSRNDLKIKTR